MIEKNEKNITIADIAAALGVSKTTVSRAISGKGRIGEETKERVKEYIKVHNYKPNMIAKSLAKSKTYNIGMIIPKEVAVIDMPFFQKCLLGVIEIAGAANYDVVVSNTTQYDISALKRLVENQKVDGIILARTLVDDIAVEYLKEQGIPFVTIGSSYVSNVIQIDNDNEEACRDLTAELFLRGIKKIGLIGGTLDHVVTRSRLAGFQRAHEEMGVKFNKDSIYLEVENNIMLNRVVEELLAEKVDCIICMDDRYCGYVLNKMRMENIRVPEDMKLASFYDSVLLDSNMTPVTSLKFDVMQLGMTTCNVLLDLIEGKTVPEKTVLGYKMELRESTRVKLLKENL